jgi:RNA polymerase-binding transcription factor DksA
MTDSLSAQERTEFGDQLRARERQLLSELRAGSERAESESFTQTASEAPDAGDASVADTATDQVSADRQRNFEELQDVQDALTRIEDGSYGLCLTCGKPIDRQRLRALPTAKYDIEHQEQLERRVGAPATPKL